jgi:hypothetical protein
MLSEDRRSFVKKSLATSMTFTFVGLIKAHGEEAGGTTTWNPEESTAETSDSGGTTTWNPDGSTVETTDGGPTTWDPDASTMETTDFESTTWNPDETTTEPETTDSKVVEVVKAAPTGDANASKNNIPAGKIKVRRKTEEGEPEDVLYECALIWKVDFAVNIGVQAQGKHVKKDCLSCELTGSGAAGEPSISLHLGTPSNDDNRMNNFQKDVLDNDFVRKGVRHTRGVEAEGVEAAVNQEKTPKVKTSSTSPLGQPKAQPQDQAIETKIDAKIEPGNDTDAATKTVTWDVEFAAPWAAKPETKTALADKVKPKFLKDHIVEIELNGITAITHQRKQTVTAQYTATAEGGDGCSCTP